MITVIILCVVFPILIGITVGAIVRKSLAAEQKKELEGKPDYDVIAKLDQELFGVGKEITGLPGYWWKVQRGCSQTINGGKKKHDPDGFSIWLYDKDSNEIATGGVAKLRPLSLGELIIQRQRGEIDTLKMVPQTIEEMDAAIQVKMKEMVDAELQKRHNEAKYAEILSKYNGKKVDEL